MNTHNPSSPSFALPLFAEALSDRASESDLVMPSSVRAALYLAVNGARGATKAAILSVLGLDERASLRDLNRSYSELVAAWQAPNANLELVIANALFARQGVPANKQFLRKSTKFYDAENIALPAGDSTLVSDWVKGATRGKVDQTLSALGSEIYLVSAIYARGDAFPAAGPADGGDAGCCTTCGATQASPFVKQEDIDLIPVCTAMGLDILMDPNRCDFGALAPVNRLRLCQARNLSLVKFDESGAEVAAVTIFGFARPASR